jgi:hypothetical protein
MTNRELRRRYNFLLRVKQVNEIFIEHNRRGVFTENIYRLYIRDSFFISRTTFYSYLTIPYARELERIYGKGLSRNSV